jgi:hypothetical protein
MYDYETKVGLRNPEERGGIQVNYQKYLLLLGENRYCHLLCFIMGGGYVEIESPERRWVDRLGRLPGPFGRFPRLLRDFLPPSRRKRLLVRCVSINFRKVTLYDIGKDLENGV